MPPSSVFLMLAFSLLSFLCLPFPSVSEKCHPNDKKALLKIKKDLNNPYALTSWKPNTDCCDWYVVECHPKTHRIVQLHLFAADVSGQIPAAISDLPYLQTLMFHKLNLTGQIPPSIAKLTNLKSLDLSWNHLSGHVPSFLTQLKKLTYLDLSFNKFSGSIPPSFSLFRNLEAIHLDRNMLTGKIPETLGHFAGRVPSLFLSHNQISGEVPRSLGNLNFDTLDFSRNKLTGDVSFLFGAKKTTFKLDFSRNLLEFDLSKVEFPASLAVLDLNHNRITGSLPEKMVKLVNLQLLNVSYNRLCGKIPAGGELQRMGYTAYFHNPPCLCGAPLPKCK